MDRFPSGESAAFARRGAAADPGGALHRGHVQEAQHRSVAAS